MFRRVIRQNIWKELADITDKSQLEWREVFQDINHHGAYQSREIVGFTRAIYTPEVLTHYPECGHDHFLHQPFEP
ncbi:hypothetical protein ACZ87_01526 [Candidatus Erwinia dacicola]|uniref:Uncharacterized protein n=1 Tax=Candidatus Erwinia dacicola TaxID=252393 RepID=A0A328TMQ6_9GAMM|nr:hypothetical protein ACZ87_01526 [Candidatus Erwinia dacicola]